MEFIFVFLQNGIAFLAQNEVFVWYGVFAIICLCFLVNLFASPYRRYNKTLKKTNVYLRQCFASKTMPLVGKIVLPDNLAEGLQNYLVSKYKFPGEVIKFVKKPYRTKGVFWVVLSLAVAFVLLCEKVVFGYMPILLFLLSCLCQVSLIALADIRHSRASNITRQTTRLLDRLFGQSKMSQQNCDEMDVCIDKEVDDVVAKINFFKQNGINEQTAKEVANLLSDEKLNKIRTKEQQKKLNLALNGLLQVMSKKQQDKQVG
ncbi:MAG: hypothetical protein IJV77_06380 [Clostridia bacterium]|nr:hypothetical protein [Clostridia bacterium]